MKEFKDLIIAAVSLVLPFVWLGSCVFLFLLSERISKRLAPNDGEIGTHFSLSLREIQAIGISLIGLLVIAQSFPTLLSIIIRIWSEGYVADEVKRATIFRQTLPETIAFSAKFIIGLYLFLGARGLASLWEGLMNRSRPLR